MSCLRNHLRGQVQLIYADLPRIEGFDELRAFQSEELPWNTWLCVVREHANAAIDLLAGSGVFVAQAGDAEHAYAFTVLAELFGHENYIGTVVWQTHYAPKSGKATSDLAITHEYLLCFAAEKSGLGRLALSEDREDFQHPDEDPRGPWEARQKDAGRDTSKVTYNVPPYRWKLTEGRFPEGIWRLSPMSGVIWGIPTESGVFPVKIEVTDSTGKASTRQLTLEVAEEGAFVLPTDVWWVTDPPQSETTLVVKTSELPLAVVNREYSVTLEARGGTPFAGLPRPKRGWAFGQSSLLQAIVEDRMYFGRAGSSIPERKRYAAALVDGKALVNVTSWWPGEAAGWTQDATKELNELLHRGVIQTSNPVAKPSALMARVLELFSFEGDIVFELFARSGDLMAAALRGGRQGVGLFGASERSIKMIDECAFPRLRDVSPEARLRRYKVGVPLLTRRLGLDNEPRLSTDYLEDLSQLGVAVLTSQGFLEISEADGPLAGESLAGGSNAIVLPPDWFLERDDIDEYASRSRDEDRLLTIFYFRSGADIPDHANLVIRRVPMELVV